MKKKPSKSPKSAKHKLQIVPTLNKDMTLQVRGGVTKSILRPREINGTLIFEAGRALSTPGVRHKSVFTGTSVSSYSVSSNDPSLFVRESSKGRKTTGRLVNGQFRPLSTK